MTENATVIALCVGGVFTLVNSVSTALIAKRVSKRKAEADIADTVSQAAGKAVEAISSSMNALRDEVKALGDKHKILDRKHKACETGRKRDRMSHARELKALRQELGKHIPEIMAQPVPSYTEADILPMVRRRKKQANG